MKRLLQITIVAGLFTVTACATQSPHNTSSARAAYGNATPDFKAHKKQDYKRKKDALKASKRKKTQENEFYFYARPY